MSDLNVNCQQSRVTFPIWTKGLSLMALGLALFVTSAVVSPITAQNTAAALTATPGTMDNMAGMGGMAIPTAAPTATMSGMTMSGSNMSPIDPGNAPAAPADAKGGQPLQPRIVAGVKEFTLNVQKIRWHILPDVEVVAYTYNGSVPGPQIRVTEGDKIRVIVNNQLDEPTTVHWHGMEIPNAQDGAGSVTQVPIAPGSTFTYEWTVPNTPGTFFYHTHTNSDVQQTLGLYGALIIDPKQPSVKYDAEYTVLLGEWTINSGKTYPSMDMEGLLPNYFTINGKSYPATDTVNVKVGQKVLLRFIGSGQFIHPMHLHGQPFKVIASDGFPIPDVAQLTKDVLLIGPGETYDVTFTARAPGKWLLHCHIAHHTTNGGAEVDGSGGLTMVFNVSP